MRTRLVMICVLALAAAAAAGGICGDPAQPNAGQTTTPAARTALPRPTVSAERVSQLAATVKSFDQFPLVWLGTSYDSDGDGVGDLPLSGAYYLPGEQLVDPRTGAEILPAERTFNLVYGTCQIPPGKDECTSPLDITIYPADQRFPPGRTGTSVRVRGVDALDENGGSLFFETADFQVDIAAWGDQAIRVANQLVGANAKAAGITKGTDFRPKGAALPVAGSCCSIQLDMDPGTAGVQAARSVSGPQDISIDIVLGDNVGSLGAFQFSLIYDDTRLTPGAAGSGGLNGNPDFNDAVLGGTWNCSLGGSSPDTDPASGPGHGVAFLACFTTVDGITIASATVIATLRLHVAASGTSSITISDALFGHDDNTDIGTCDASGGGTMTCAGGTVTAP